MANDKPFTVSVEGSLSDDGVWNIDARLRWRDGAPPLGSRLLGLGRLALLEGIAREASRGRSLGATKVRVCMEGHDKVAVTLGEPESS